MSVALLFPNNIYTSPYLRYYTQILENSNIPYDIITWNRSGITEENCISFNQNENRKTIYSRLSGFFKYRNFVIEKTAEKKYDKVIVFSCQLGILLSSFLNKKYKNQYLIDIRDYSKIIPFFKSRFKKLLLGANTICISSNGFKKWLPKEKKYTLSHNIDISLIEKRLKSLETDKVFFKSDTIFVDTIGQIKDYHSDKKFVTQLMNNDSFYMNFIGFGPTLEPLKKFSIENSVSNINFNGPYEKNEEESLLANTDFINILISDNKFNNGVTSNRLYLSALLNIPCIVNNQTTEQKKIIQKYKFGIIVDKYEELPNKLIDYKENFTKTDFVNGCNLFLNKVKEDYQQFQNKIQFFLTEK